MAIKFDFNKLRTAVEGWLGGTDLTGASLTAGEQAIYVPKMRSAKIIQSVAADVTLTGEDSGKLLMFNVASGATVTLPAAAGTGIEYHFVVNTTVTSNDYIVQVVGNDTIDGLILNCDDDSSDAVAIWKTAATSDTITLNGGTTGGIIGDTFKLTDIAADQWLLHAGATSATGTVATPFSAAVS
jgi:hypothetical protein